MCTYTHYIYAIKSPNKFEWIQIIQCVFIHHNEIKFQINIKDTGKIFKYFKIDKTFIVTHGPRHKSEKNWIKINQKHTKIVETAQEDSYTVNE